MPLTLASVAARWPEVDLAALRLPAPLENPPAWDVSILPMLSPVASIGFPYGYDHENTSVTSRGFAGHSAGTNQYARLKGKPEVYEVTFAAPRGLSGAPLLRGDGIICGVILGNFSTEMTVFSDRERVEERGEVTITERFEALNLGIAVCARTVLSLQLPTAERLLDFVLAAGA